MPNLTAQMRRILISMEILQRQLFTIARHEGAHHQEDQDT